MSPCQEWPKAKKKCNGYGVINVIIDGKPKQLLAHRWTWEQNKGPIPHGLCVLHKCDNRACINIDHLFLGTQAENMADMDRKGRRRHGVTRGSKVNTSIFSEEQVRFIRAAFEAGLKIRPLQQQLGGTYQSIWAIVKRRTWTHI